MLADAGSIMRGSEGCGVCFNWKIVRIGGKTGGRHGRCCIMEFMYVGFGVERYQKIRNEDCTSVPVTIHAF